MNNHIEEKLFSLNLKKQIKAKKSVISVATTGVLVLLMLSAVCIGLCSFQVAQVNADTVANSQATSIPSSLLQYEWETTRGEVTGTYFNDGPAPESPSIQWKVKIPGVVGPLVAFSGKIFCQSPNGLYALNAANGRIEWKNTDFKTGIYGFGSCIAKIDETYMLIGSTCLRIADGSKVWIGPTGFSLPSLAFSGIGYVPDLKMVVSETYGWDLSDPSQPPTLVWNRTSQIDVGAGYCGYGDGKIFSGGTDFYLRALDARTGELLWKTPVTTTTFIYGMTYAEGKIIHGGMDGIMNAWDANTGELLWSYNPDTHYNMWASSTAYAYGIIFSKNQDTYLYAVNATTGQLVWKAKGPGIGYSNLLSIADGKVYVHMGENMYRDPDTGEFGYSEFDCYDAFTGELVWTLPMENDSPTNYQCIAYGNLYVIPTLSTSVPGVWTYTYAGTPMLDEVWCISSQPRDWAMFLADPTHSAEGDGPTNLQLKWKYTAGAAVVSSPTLVNGKCYFGCLDGKIYAIDANSGEKIWTFETKYEVKSSVAVVDGKLYTGGDDGNFYCLNAETGAKIWSTGAGEVLYNTLSGGRITPVRSSPMVVDGYVYVGSLDGNLYKLRANNGQVVWKFQTGGPILATPTIADTGIYITACTPKPNGVFYKLDADTGSVIYKKDIPYVLNRTLGLGEYVFASPTVAEGMVFVRNGLYENFAFNATTGDLIWTYHARFNAGTPIQSGGTLQSGATLYKYGMLYMNDFYGTVALNAANGSEVWYTYLSRENLAAGISYAYGRVYIVTEARVLYVLDSLTGEKLSFRDFEGTPRSVPTLYNGSLYLGCTDWNVYCFGEARLMSQTSQPSPAATPTPTPTQTTAPTQAPTVAPTQTSAPKSTSTPPATNQPSPTQSANAQQAIFAVPNEVLIGVGAVVIIVVVAATAVLMKRRRK